MSGVRLALSFVLIAGCGLDRSGNVSPEDFDAGQPFDAGMGSDDAGPPFDAGPFFDAGPDAGRSDAGPDACVMTGDPTDDCDLVDDDCDGAVDEDCECTPGASEPCGCTGMRTCSGGGRWGNCNGDSAPEIYYLDDDGDTFGDPNVTMEACAQPTGYVTNDNDCDDACMACGPGGTEACDNRDNDCDMQIDEAGGVIYYTDSDGDGFGDGAGMNVCFGDPGPGFSTNDTDCDDTCRLCHPGYAAELCNDGNDNNCNGSTDEGGCTCNYYDLGATGEYIFCTNPLSWTAARDRCVGLDGHLAAFETDEERAAVWAVGAIDTYNAGTGHIWLGGTDAAMEGVWVWANGVELSRCAFSSGNWTCSCSLDYCPWEGSQPNASATNNSDDCTTVNPMWDGEIGDYPCGNAQAFLCEL